MSSRPGTQAGYGVQRTLQTLELLAHGPITAVELADKLMIHRRTARRILQRLAIDGFARKTSYSAPFEPTQGLRDLGQRLAEAEPAAVRET